MGFWKCSDSVLFVYEILEVFWQCVNLLWNFGTVLTVLMFYGILELFSQCVNFLWDFGTVLTACYFCIGFWNCSDSVLFVFWNCSDSVIFLLDFGTVLTVCYFCMGFWNCSGSALFFYGISELFWQSVIFWYSFLLLFY